MTVDGHLGESLPPSQEVHRLYDAEAVDQYVAALQQEMADLQARVDEANQVAQAAQQQMVEAEAAQALLGRAWLTAQADVEAKLAEAERQASEILEEAQRQADAHLADTRIEAQAIIDEAHHTIEAVFTAMTRRTEPGAALAQPTIDLTTPLTPEPPAHHDLRTEPDQPTPGAGPWFAPPAPEPVTAVSAAADAASAAAVGAQIVELSSIERRLHTLASRATTPVGPRGDAASPPAAGAGSTEWSGGSSGSTEWSGGSSSATESAAPEPTGTGGSAAGWTEADRERSDTSHPSYSYAANSPPAPSAAPPELSPAASAGPHQWGAETAATPPPSTPWEPPAVAVPAPDGVTTWSGPPPTAGWAPTAARLDPPTQWSSPPPPEADTPEEAAVGAGMIVAPFEPAADSGAVRPPATLAGWRERWRLARDGTSPLDGDMLSRADRLASLEDGTYVGELRDGADPPADAPLDDERAILELLPPPTGSPVIFDETIGQAVEQARFRRPLKRAGG